MSRKKIGCDCPLLRGIITRQDQQIKKLEAELEEMRKRELVDPLTKIWNRDGLFNLLDIEIGSISRKDFGFGVVMIDIDNFKQYNSDHGWLTGSRVLVEVARTLTATTRSSDFVGRLSGDEFLVIFPETDERKTVELAERIRENVSRCKLKDKESPIEITVSIGATLVSKMTAPEKIIGKIDRALSKAKKTGKNKVVLAK